MRDGFRDQTSSVSLAIRNRAIARRSLALGGSILLHTILFIVGFRQSSGELSPLYGERASDTVGTMAVELVRRAAPVTQSSSQADQFRITARAGLDTLPAISANNSPLNALAGRLTTEGAKSSTSSLTSAPSERYATTAPPGKDDSDQESPDRSASGAGEDVWGAVTSCWQRRASPIRTEVAFEFVINAQGQFGKAPTVIRQAASLADERRLRSEEDALRTIAGCVTDNRTRLRQRRFRVEIKPAPGGATITEQ